MRRGYCVYYMARKRKTEASQKPIEQYEHKGKQRLNNPPMGLVDSHTDNGAKEGWATLAKNLKAIIDEEKIESYGGTVSLPFTPGKAVAVKIIDARGIESLKIIRI